MTAARRKGVASAMFQSMGVTRQLYYRGKWQKWPDSQSEQPGDQAPDLRSVDESDPPGIRLPPGCDTGKEAR